MRPPLQYDRDLVRGATSEPLKAVYLRLERTLIARAIWAIKPLDSSGCSDFDCHENPFTACRQARLAVLLTYQGYRKWMEP